MARRRNGRTTWRQAVEADLELLPLMNLFIVLIPMMLVSAVFLQVKAIDMALPSAAEHAPPPPAGLDLSVAIRDAAYVVRGNGLAEQVVPRGPHGPGGVPEREAWAGLARALRDVATAHPEERGVRILAASTTRYEEIVAVMDVARGAGLPEAALEDAGTEDR